MYESLLEQDALFELLDSTRAALDGTNATIFVAPINRFLSLAPPEMQQNYFSLMNEDPWVLAASARNINGVVTAGELVNPKIYRKSRVHSEFNSPLDIHDMIACGKYDLNRPGFTGDSKS